VIRFAVRQVFKTRSFARWSRKTQVSDLTLRNAIAEMAAGLIDADLGGSVYKKRVPLPGRGKSGGARVLVATRHTNRWFLLYGFGKNEQVNIDDRELAALQKIGQRVALNDVRATGTRRCRKRIGGNCR
jgi:hypothetical protein